MLNLVNAILIYTGGNNVNTCNAQRTQTDFLSQGAQRKSLSESPIFYRSESAHTARLFIAEKTSDLPYNFLSKCHLANTA